jgi:hypothetical protein
VFYPYDRYVVKDIKIIILLCIIMSESDENINTPENSACSTPVHIDMTKNDSFDAATKESTPSSLPSDNSLETILITPAISIDLAATSATSATSLSGTSLEGTSLEKDPQPLISQDTSQKLGVATIVAVEIYRALVASFLILFVPQDCGGHVCSFSENAETGSDPLYNAGFVFNCITMAAFIALYYTEVRRESKLISYLDVNPEKASDNDSVGLVLDKMPKYCSEAILYYDGLYIKTGYTVIVCFAVNTVLSGLVVYKYYLDDKTTTTYITSVLFVIQKLIQVYATLKTEKNVFYSAYLTGKIQYNDIDKDKVFVEDVKKDVSAMV